MGLQVRGSTRILRFMGRYGTALALLLIALIALAARSVSAPDVFADDGSVILSFADSLYHAHRALFSFLHFPSVLWFDWYLNFPAGSPVPWPPAYDWLLGGVARLFGSEIAGFERVVAWAPAVIGALTTLPVYVVGRRLAGRGVGLGAAAIFAVLPAAAVPARVGNPDHHAAVALLGAVMLATALAFVADDDEGAPSGPTAAAWAAVTVLMALTWSGSLLYLGLGHALVGSVSVARGRRRALLAQAFGALAAAAALLPVVHASRPILGGPLSTINLSFLHALALAAVAAVAAGVAGLEWKRPASGPALRLLRAACLVVLLVAAAQAVPDVREALTPAVAFLTQQDSWAQAAIEAQPLFGSSPAGSTVQLAGAVYKYGIFAYLLPVCALLAWARVCRREAWGSSFVFAGWATVVGFLAVRQIRYTADFTPAAAVVFALLVSEAARILGRLAGRVAPLAIVAPLLGAILLFPAWTGYYAPRLFGPPGEVAGMMPGNRSLMAFARELRAATPEAGGYLEVPQRRPSYGVLAPAGIGHAIRWWARRPTSVDNFGPYLDAERYRAVESFYTTSDEGEAMRIARELGTRYVVTVLPYALRLAEPRRLERRLHLFDGGARGGAPGLGQLRLVLEGPAGGTPLFPISGAVALAPYKLFEVVEGAVLSVRADPGSLVRAELDLATDAGRRFRWHTGRRVGASGEVALRVPYPSAGASAEGVRVHGEGPWRVRVGDWQQSLAVSEADVREGRIVRADD